MIWVASLLTSWKVNVSVTSLDLPIIGLELQASVHATRHELCQQAVSKARDDIVLVGAEEEDDD
jgi:hypothetical protein